MMSERTRAQSWSRAVLLVFCLIWLRNTDGFAPNRHLTLTHSCSWQRHASSSSSRFGGFMPILTTKYHDRSTVMMGRRKRAITELSMSTTTSSETNALSTTYSALMEKLPSPKVIEAAEKCSKGDGSVIASDLATAAGISLSQARRDLTTLATLSRGDIQVTTDGDLLYRFPSNLNAALASNSAKFKALATVRKAWPAIFWFARVSFGVVLLTSLFAIFSTILFVSASGGSSSDSDERDDRRRGGMGFGYGAWGGFWGPSPFDFFYYRPYYSYYYYPDPTTGMYRDPEEMGFLESVFSYVFGDGNPNARLEEERLQKASAMIRANNGAVTAEQLAVYCDVEDESGPPMDDTGNVDESFVLPIVTALGGEPRVTEEGDIVYVFPELQITAASKNSLTSRQNLDRKTPQLLRRAGLPGDASASDIKMLLRLNGIETRGAVEKSDLVDLLADALGEPSPSAIIIDDEDDPSILLEKEYQFSLAPDLNKLLAGGLGIVNLGGALYLGNILSQAALYGVRLPSYFGLVQKFYPGLLLYAVLFNAVPFIRKFWIGRQNARIGQRNANRRSWRNALRSGGSTVRRKLSAAKRLGTKLRQLRSSGKDILYDTSKPMDETEQRKQQQALDDFDKLLGN